MPFNREERTEKLKEILDADETIGLKPVMGTEMKVYEIPLDYLIFNKENGRIRTQVKTWESLNKRELNQEEYEEDFNLIAKFIWESKEGANKKTTKNLKERNQEVAGEVTADGVVVGGNRRLRCLMEANIPSMKCVILPEKAGENVAKLLTLEKTLQNTVEGIVDYGANEKYLECLDMVRAFGGEKKNDGKWLISDECFKKINESNPDRYKSKHKIHGDLKILEMMENYLEETGNPGCYALLNDKEDYFIDLASSYEIYLNNTEGYTEDGWNPTRSDVSTWVRMCHAVIKAGFQGGKNETKQYRKLLKKGTKGDQGRNSFFGHREAFHQLKEDFEKEIFPIFDKIKTLDEVSNMGDVDPIEQCITEEENFKKEVDGKLVGFFNIADRKLQERTDEGFVERQLLNVWSSLKSISFDENLESWPPKTDNFEELKDLANKIRQKSAEVYKELKKIK